MFYLELFNKYNTCFKQVWDIDYEYQAQQWIEDTLHTTGANAVRWVLRDKASMSLQMYWERPADSQEMPIIAKRYN